MTSCDGGPHDMRKLHARKLRTVSLALFTAGVVVSGSVLVTHVASAAEPPRAPCPQTVPLVPGEDNDIVGVPDNIGVSAGGHIGLARIKNIHLVRQTGVFCHYGYDVFNEAEGVQSYAYSRQFRIDRPF